MLFAPVRAFLAIILAIWYRVRYEGRDKVPKEGGCIIAANHLSYLDPPMVGVANLRPTNFMAKAELFKMPILSFIMPRIRAFPVHRGAGDRQAIKRALELLAQGEVVGVFPEGTRNRTGGEMLSPQGGAAMLALKATVPVVPAAVWGTEKASSPHFPHTVKIGVRFGDPIYFPQVDNINKEAVAGASKQIMEAIKNVLDEVKSTSH